jgi:putative glutamine amidotransferase
LAPQYEECKHCGGDIVDLCSGAYFHVGMTDSGESYYQYHCDPTKQIATVAEPKEQKGGDIIKATDTVGRPVILILEGLSGTKSCVMRAGGAVIEVDPWKDDAIEEAFKTREIHGMLLTGGGDVNPELYHRKPHKKVYGVSNLRDYGEWIALDWAQEKGIPVMGICRGSQIMNVWAGGTLWQHIGGHYGTFPVAPLEGTVLHTILEGNAHLTKHLHHQAVKNVAPNFTMAAVSKDRHVEAIESLDGRCIGVQFHPEMLSWSRHGKALFRWLVCESAKRAGLEEPTEREYSSSYWTPTDDEDYWNYRSEARRAWKSSSTGGSGGAVSSWTTDGRRVWELPPVKDEKRESTSEYWSEYPCPACDDFGFQTKAGWEAHLFNTHRWKRDEIATAWSFLDTLKKPENEWGTETDDNIFGCTQDGCTAGFPTRDEQIDHLVMVHDIQDLSALLEDYHRCGFCDDTDIDNPMTTMPTGARVCDGCRAIMEGAE